MNFDKQNNPDYPNQQDTGLGQQNQPGWSDQQQNISNLDQTQDTGGYNQGSTGLGSTYRAGESQADYSGQMGQESFGQRKLGTQTSDTSGLQGGARGWDSSQNIGSTTDYSSTGNQQQYGGDDTANLGSTNIGSTGGDFGSGGQSYGGTQGRQAQNAWDDPSAQTGNTGGYNDTGDNWGSGQQQQGTASTGDKIKGGLKKLAGKVTNDPSKIAKGDMQQSTGDSNIM